MTIRMIYLTRIFVSEKQYLNPKVVLEVMYFVVYIFKRKKKQITSNRKIIF